MGIAHDAENAYWYNDGFQGELVYYDFQEDHDTGQDDHSDGIVTRYVNLLTRSPTYLSPTKWDSLHCRHWRSADFLGQHQRFKHHHQ